MPTDSTHQIRPIAAGCARYIGRVGALAVALGIGAAVATGYGFGVAQADDTATSDKTPSVDASSDSPSTASDDQASQQSPAPGSKQPAPAAAKDDISKTDMDVVSSGGPDTSVNDGGQSTDSDTNETSHVPDAGVDDRKSDAAKSSSEAHHSQAATGPRSVKNPPVSRSAITSVPSPTPTRKPLARTPEDTAPVAAQQLSTVTTVHDPQLVSTAVAAPAIPARAPGPTLVTTFVSAVLSPLLTPGPGIPVDPPVVLGLLGWVRNEEQRRYSDDSASLMSTAAAVGTTPVATKDSATTKEDTAVTVNVLANDTDANLDPLTTAVVSGPTNGSVVHNADGSFTYTPAANFNGTDTFTYLANDGFTDSAPATVTVKVTAVNDAPVANPDGATTAEDTAVRIDVKANDTDVENNTTTAAVVTKPTNGTVTRNTDGTYTYTPKANFTGTDTFTYRLYDGAYSAPATVTITVTAVNDAPTAAKDSASTKEDTAVTVNVLANDKDPDGDVLTAAVATGPANGTVTTNVDGTFTYTPNQNFYGTDSFTYVATDGALSSAPVAVTVKIAAVNDAPIANPDTATTAEDTAVVIDVKANDTDVENNTLTPWVLTRPANGTVVRNVDGTYTYTPKANFAGTDTFTYRLYDGANSNPATVTVTITAVNDAPTAAKDSATTKEDTAVTINVLANDKDPDGGPLTTALATAPANGELNHNADGSFTYTPAANFNGTDTFTYTVNDGTSDSTPATVTIKITAVNDAPVANPDTATTTEGTPVTIDVKANDTDVENNTLTPTVLTKPVDGTVVRNADGNYTYTPKANFAGTDTFTYRLYDGANSNPATVTVTVNPVGPANHPPTAGNISFNNTPIPGGSSVVSTVSGDVSDPDGDTLSAAVVDQPTHGTVTMTQDGNFTYVAPTNFTGSDTFTYRVFDGTVYSNTAIVTINNIVPANHAPTAQNISVSMSEDGGLSGVVSTSTTDEDGDPLTASVLGQPAYGTVEFVSAVNYIYSPAANFNGVDSFTYRLFDGTQYSNVATVTITVNPTNDAPVASNDSTSTNEDTAVTIDVLANDSDADGDSLTTTVVTDPTHGSITHNVDGSFTYTPAANYNGTDTFTYRASDATTGTTATVTVTITPVNDVVVAQNRTVSMSEDGGLSSVVSVSLTDVDGDPLTASVVDQPLHGTVEFVTGVNYTYTPAANYNGTDTFTYRLFDGTAYSNTATVTITVNPTNDAPIATADTFTTAEDAQLTGNVITNTNPNGADTDIDNPNPTAILVSNVQHGTLTLNANGSFTYTPTANYNGSDAFTYKLNDGQADSNTATVSITITAVDESSVLTGEFDSVHYSADGLHAYVVAEVHNLTTNAVTSTTVALVDRATGAMVGTPLTFTNSELISVEFSEARADLITKSTTQPKTTFTSVNILDGSTVDTVTLNGELQSVQYDDSRSRALVITAIAGPSGVTTTTVSVLDNGTLTVLDSPFTFNGDVDTLAFTGFNQTGAILTFVTGTTSRVVIFDTVTGHRAPPQDLTGRLAQHPLVVLNQTKVGVLTDTGGSGPATTTLNIVNVTNGSVSHPPAVFGRFDSVQYSENRVYLVTQTLGTPTATVTIFDRATGSIVGNPLTVTGELGELVLNPSATRALFTYTDKGTGHLAVIDTSDATRIGDPINLPGQLTDSPLLSNNATLAAIITTTTGKNATTTITTINLNTANTI